MSSNTDSTMDTSAVTGADLGGMGDLSVLGPEAAMYFHQLTEKMPGGFFIYRAAGGEELLYANAPMLELFGCDSAAQFMALTGGTFPGLVHPDDLDEVQQSIREQIAASAENLDYVEYRIVRRDGAVRWVEDYGHFTHNEYAGDIFYVFVSDATERRRGQLALLGQKDQALEQLSGEHRQNMEIIQGLSVDYESIFSLDLTADTWRPYRMSPRAAAELEQQGGPRPFSEFAKAYIARCVCPEDRETVTRALALDHLRERLSRRGTYHLTYRVVGSAGPEYLQLRCVDVSGAQRGERAVVGVRLVDSEIVVQLDQKRLLEEALQQAQSAEIARSTFLSNMSHDIRTPMNAIMGLAALAKVHAGDPAKVRSYMGRIEEAGEQLLSLLSDVLELSRLESGKISIEEEPCLLADVAGDVDKRTRPQAEKKGLQFSVDLSAVQSGSVYCDRRRLAQVLLCLTSNAVKYTPAGGRVDLILEEAPSEMRGRSVYRFLVSDTGVGMSPAFLKRLYQPFERERSTTQSGVQGTGLGLPIAKGLVEMMGGTLDAKSRKGKGTCFTLTLSLCLYQPEPKQAPLGHAAHNAFAGMRLLLVEDNAINIMIETELLQNVGFLVEVAQDGRIAVDKVKDSAPGDYQLILMDIQMPIMDGWEATRAIRALKDPALAAIPIVALSANAFDRDVRLSLECGMQAHLPKPLHIPQLLEQIARIVGEGKEDG